MVMQRPSFWASIIHFFRWIVGYWQAWWFRRAYSGPVITLDTGRRVRIGPKIAEGGFSIVFEATDANGASSTAAAATATPPRYALKRILCADPELLRTCRKEAGVHRSVRHPNLMPLLGMSVVDTSNIYCYMLFPLVPHSLRSEVNQRTFARQQQQQHDDDATTPPWSSEVTVLHIFYRLLSGVQALHERAHYSHRDIKLENIQLAPHWQPILMDFGSSGPVRQSLATRRDVLEAMEHATVHTTISYRPPELFEGGIRAGEEDLDYTAVDVWSLGCTLFAMLYGASPCESEFSRRTGLLQVVECTQLSVLQPVPRPPPDTAPFRWYQADLHDLLVLMLQQDRRKRPALTKVMAWVQALIEKRGGHVEDDTNADQIGTHSYKDSIVGDDDMDDNDGMDGIALMNHNRMGV